MMTIHITDADAKKIGAAAPKRRSKYNSSKVKVDGLTFDSKAEADYYCRLKLLLRAGKIDGFCRQARFIVTEGRNGERGTEYVTDFVVFYSDGTYKIVDVKGMQTDVFRLKMKCLREKYPNIKIELEGQS